MGRNYSLIAALLFSVWTPVAKAAPVPYNQGTLYEIGSNQSKVLFNFELDDKQSSDQRVVNTRFFDLSGNLASTEHLILSPNGDIVRYDFVQRQVNEKGTLTVQDGKIHFSYTKDGKTKTDTEKLPPNLVVGPSMVQYIIQRWPGVLQGETYHIRMAVLDRLETVGFKFFKVGEKTVDGKTMVRVKLKPSSFIIAAIVDPIYLWFEKDSATFQSVIGRTLLKKRDGDDWKDLDAEAVFRKSREG